MVGLYVFLISFTELKITTSFFSLSNSALSHMNLLNELHGLSVPLFVTSLVCLSIYISVSVSRAARKPTRGLAFCSVGLQAYFIIFLFVLPSILFI